MTFKRGRIPWTGLFLVLAIGLAILAFGLFKRKGARKPPPIPAAIPMEQPTSAWA